MSGIQLNDNKNEYPWPEKGDKLFLAGDDWWNNACLNYGSNEWELLILGYKKAGDILVDHIIKTHSDQDFLVFPIVFVFRQYIELRLKKLIIDCMRLDDQDPFIYSGHNLGNLWEKTKSHLDKIVPKPEKIDIEAIDAAIKQFSELDPGSQAFRYPSGKDGTKLLPSNLKLINLRNLADVMEKLSNFFEASEMMLSVYLDNKNEMDKELGISI